MVALSSAEASGPVLAGAEGAVAEPGGPADAGGNPAAGTAAPRGAIATEKKKMQDLRTESGRIALLTLREAFTSSSSP